MNSNLAENETKPSGASSSGNTDSTERTVVIQSSEIPFAKNSRTDPESGRTQKSQTTASVHTGNRDRDPYEALFDLSYPEPESPVDFATDMHGIQPVTDENIQKKYSFASGGQGVLYCGADRVLNRRIAVKSLRKEWCTNEAHRNAFISEARITAQLEHPGILPIHSLLKEENDGVSVSMKMLRGMTLDSYLTRVCEVYEKYGFNASVEAKSLQLRFDVFLKVCDALDYAHSRNVMHCDLKPENIMIGEYHDAYLMDWGIAHPIVSKEYDPETWVKKTTVSGTASYIAPEVLSGDYSDQRADVYAMGLILFEIVTLNRAFTGGERMEIFQKVLAHEMNPLHHKFGYAIPADLRAVIEKAAAAFPDDRYASIRDMANDIRKYLSLDEVSAHPDSFLMRIYRKCVIKHVRTTIIVLLAILLAAVGYSALSLWHVLTVERDSNVRKTAIGYNYVQCQDTANLFDRELTEIEYSLHVRSKIFTSLLSDQVKLSGSIAGTTNAVPASCYSTPGKIPASYLDYPQYGGKMDFEHISYVGQKKISGKELKQRIQIMEGMFYPVRELMIESPFNTRLILPNRQILLNNMLHGEVPVTLVSFSFTDGFYFCYPGESLPDDFDPRNREWYKTRMDPASPYAGWSVPYMDYTNHGVGITYSIRLMKEDRSVIGAAALILDLSRAVELLLNAQKEQPWVLEKTFLDASGSVIITTNGVLKKNAEIQYSRNSSSGGASTGFLYPNPELVEAMQREQNGFLIQKEGGRSIVYVFAVCRKLNWFFIQKIDLERAMKAGISR